MMFSLPKHSLMSVARELSEGLESGKIVLRRKPEEREESESTQDRLFAGSQPSSAPGTEVGKTGEPNADPSLRFRDHLVHSELITALGRALLGVCGPFGAPLAFLLKFADELQDWERPLWEALKTKQHPNARALPRHFELDSETDFVAEESIRWIWIVSALLHDVGFEATKDYQDGITGLQEFQKAVEDLLQRNIEYLSEQGIPTEKRLAWELEKLYSDLDEFDAVVRRSGLSWSRSAKASRESVFKFFVDTCSGLSTNRLAKVFEVLSRDKPQSRIFRVEALATRKVSEP